jgi:hypothetical protein
MATLDAKMAFPDELELHPFLDLNLPVADLDPYHTQVDWLQNLPSPNHSADVSENSLNSLSGSSHFPFVDSFFPAAETFPVQVPASESPPGMAAFPPIPAQVTRFKVHVCLQPVPAS